MTVVPNIHFQGACEAAIALYKRALDAKVDVLLHYTDAHPADGAYGSEYDKLVYHAEISIGGQRVVMSDSPMPTAPAGNTVSLMLSMDSLQAAQMAYDRLVDGATVLNAPVATTYSGFMASLIDRFGVRWELNYEL